MRERVGENTREDENDWYSKHHFKQDEAWTTVNRRRGRNGATEGILESHQTATILRGRERNSKSENTIFIDNLPPFYESFLLKKLFWSLGKVVDSYIPWRRRVHRRTKYGFIRFGKEEEAVRARKKMDGVLIFGHKLCVKRCFNGEKKTEGDFKKTEEEFRKTKQQENNNVEEEDVIAKNKLTDGRSYAEVASEKKFVWRKKPIEKYLKDCEEDNRTV